MPSANGRERLAVLRAGPTAAGLVVSAVLGLTVARAEDWPQWRGTHRDGVSRESVAPWGADGLKVLWQVPTGEGHASPVVAGGLVVIHTKDGDDELVSGLDAASGQTLWQHRYKAPFLNRFGSGPRATPTLADGRVFTLGATGILHALSLADGKVLWRVDTFADFQATNLFFGVSTSPLVDGDRLLVNVGGPQASVVAFGVTDGQVIWKAGTDRASYASPSLIGQGAARQVVFVTFSQVIALDPSTGAILWTVPLKTRNDENAVTPLGVGDLVIVSSVSGGLLGLAPQRADQGSGVTQVWHDKLVNCYFSSPVTAGDGLVFALHGAPAQLSCLRAKDGQRLWTHPPEVGLLKPGVGLLHGSLMVVGGPNSQRLLLLSDTGRLSLIEPLASGYRELAASKVCGSTWVHPALADGRLYIKDAEGLRCLALPAARDHPTAPDSPQPKRE